MTQIDVNRRTLLAALLKGAVTTVAAHYWTGLATADSTLTIPGPEADAAGEASFAMFHALSRIVTLREHLDESAARRMYPLFMEEPWGAHHIHSTYTQLLGLIGQADRKQGIPFELTKGGLGKGQAWFADHLLTTWYLGVYYHARMPPLRVAYTEAIMFDAVAPTLPQRFVEGTGFGAWGQAVTTRARA